MRTCSPSASPAPRSSPRRRAPRVLLGSRRGGQPRGARVPGAPSAVACRAIRAPERQAPPGNRRVEISGSRGDATPAIARMRRMRSLLVLFVLGAVAGCQTQFVGDPHIEPITCQAKCREANLVMAGMVYLGQYSSACLCEVPRHAAPPGA